VAARPDIVSYAEQLLDSIAFSDYCPNGLQVIGSDEVTSIATSVSCSREVFRQAANLGAQLLLVHHGLFWKNTPQTIDDAMRTRLKLLFDHDINLVGFHLPLDAHATYGNNARICAELGLTRLDAPFAVMGGHSIGCIGKYDDALDHAEFSSRLQEVVGGRTPLALGVTDRPIRTVAICSGGAAGELAAAAAAGADAFITGEANEPAHATAIELGISFFAAGHHATETFGVRALGDHLGTTFGVKVTHLEADNPV